MKKYVLKANKPVQTNLPESFYDGLNSAQREAIEFGEGPLLLIAGAGSGKTKTLVHRVARLVHEGVPPERILLLTFTRKASQEMLQRASHILDDRCREVSGGTFHSFANIILRRYAENLGFPDQFSILDRADAESIVGLIRKECGHAQAEKRFPKKGTVASIIGKHVNTGRPIADILSSEYPQYCHFEAEILEIQGLYVLRKKEQAVMDYDDLLIKLAELLMDHPTIRAEISAMFDYVMVDEYQDTNALQAQIIQAIVNEAHNVLVVGDDAQSIYSFRGADFKNIMSFPDLFPNVTTITLDQNYRSKQPILALTNAVIAGAKERYAKTLFSELEGGDKPIFIETETENDQSRFICQKILELREEGVPLDEIAVLFRSSSHSNDLEVSLKSDNIPFVKYGGFKFTETAHIKDAVAHMRVVYNPTDGISWSRTLLLLEGVGPKMADTIYKMVQDVNGNLACLDLTVFSKKKFYISLCELFSLLLEVQDLSPSDLVSKVVTYFTPILKTTYDDYHKRTSDLDSLQVIAERYDALETFLTEISLDPPEGSQVDSEPEDSEDEKLILSTIHSSKGLEFHTVFVMSLVDGYLPSFRALGDMAQLEEERRLLYVAMTRAKENLFLLKPNLEMGGDSYYNYSGFHFSKVSRFLDERSLLDEFTEKWALVEEKEDAETFTVTEPSYEDDFPTHGRKYGF